MSEPVDAPGESSPIGPTWPRPRDLAIATGFYTVCVVAATWPVATRMSVELPSGSDPVQHLWILRWYKQCLLEGRLPFHAPDVQYPIGAPLAFFSPMHLQSVLYPPISLVISNNVLIYNLLWFTGLLSTGLGSFVLGWVVLRHRAAALLTGLLAMLSTPVMIHAIGHLELIYLGAVPLFLACWMRLVDQPTPGRLLAAVSAYLLTTMSAAYYALLVIFPAALYALPALVGRPWGESRSGLPRRWLGLLGFVVLALPGLGLLFGAQVWGAWHGLSLTRSRVEFEAFGSPLWSYLTPTHFHAMSAVWPFNLHLETGQGAGMVETASYLGLASILLLHRAARRPGVVPRAAFWWTGLVLLVVLSFGARGAIGEQEISLPANWLWQGFPPFRLIRMPVRFNLLAVIFASVLAGAACRDLLQSARAASWRWLTFAGLVAVAVADLAFVPFPGGFAPPPLPSVYQKALALDPDATFLDAPTAVSSGADATSSLACYWQSLHGGRTTAGYSGLPNPDFDNRVFQGSPFSRQRLADPDYLVTPESMSFGLVEDVAFDDYAWLFLRANGLRYLALHESGLATAASEATRNRLLDRLQPARIAAAGGVHLYDHDLLPSPGRPVLVCLDGWKRPPGWLDPRPCVVDTPARLAIYLPTAHTTVRLRIEAWAIEEPRLARLRCGTRTLAHWRIEPDGFREFLATVTDALPGYQEWTLELVALSDSEATRQESGIRVRSLKLDTPTDSAQPTLAQRAPDDEQTTEPDLGRTPP